MKLESDKKEKEEVAKKIAELEKSLALCNCGVVFSKYVNSSESRRSGVGGGGADQGTEQLRSLKQDRLEASKLSVAIKHRFHFSSDLQRMSTICKVTSSDGKCQSGMYSLVKGSPEAIGQLLVEKPGWYDAAYKRMAEQGQRVLALAYSKLSDASDVGNRPRSEIECKLTFGGFIAIQMRDTQGLHAGDPISSGFEPCVRYAYRRCTADGSQCGSGSRDRPAQPRTGFGLIREGRR